MEQQGTMAKLNTKLVKELMESGCEYDEAVRLVENGVRIKRIEAKRPNKKDTDTDEGKHRRV